MPEGLTITAITTNRCNFNCDNCVAGCPNNDKPEIDFDVMMRWLDKYTPGCNLHISGGEPLLVDSIYDKVKMCVDTGYDVTIFTNGTFIKQHLDLVELPVKWHVTHHSEMVSVDTFLEDIEPIKSKPHVVCRLRHGYDALNKAEEAERLYSGYNFKWIVPFNGYAGYAAQPSEKPICKSIMMIDGDGTVYPCSTGKAGVLGNTYDMTFDVDKANNFECICGKNDRQCRAYQSAEIMAAL